MPHVHGTLSRGGAVLCCIGARLKRGGRHPDVIPRQKAEGRRPPQSPPPTLQTSAFTVIGRETFTAPIHRAARTCSGKSVI